MRPRLDPCASGALAALILLGGCTGRVPGTGANAQSRPGVVYETVRVAPPPAPEIASAGQRAEPLYAAPGTPAAEGPSYEVPAAPASVPAPAPAYSAPAPESVAPSGARDPQLAILTEAVTALRQEISRSYAHSQELMEETKKLRVQLKGMRSELEKARGENDKLRAQVRTLERRLKEIRVSPPVAGPAAAAPEAPAAPAPAPAPEEAPVEEGIPEPPVVDEGGPPDQDAGADLPENTAPSP